MPRCPTAAAGPARGPDTPFRRTVGAPAPLRLGFLSRPLHNHRNPGRRTTTRPFTGFLNRFPETPAPLNPPRWDPYRRRTASVGVTAANATVADSDIVPWRHAGSDGDRSAPATEPTPSHPADRTQNTVAAAPGPPLGHFGPPCRSVWTHVGRPAGGACRPLPDFPVGLH